MRQTLVKEGLQLRLQDLLGNNSDANNVYSIQSSMLEDMNRICKAIVGDSQYGRVMAGMTISPYPNYFNVGVSAGYGITPGGKVIKIGSTVKSDSQLQYTWGETYNIYANNIEEERGSDVGGYSAPVTRSSGNVKIISDQVGSYENGTDNKSSIDPTKYVITYETGALTSSPDKIYLGSMVVDGTGLVSVVYPKSTNTFTSFMYKQDIKSTLINATDLIYSTFSTNSEVTLAEGKNYLRSLQFIMRGRSTSSLRATTSMETDVNDYLIHFDIYGKKSGGDVGRIFSDVILNDSFNSFSFQSAPINQVIDSSYISLFLNPKITTANFTTADSPVQCSVSYIIEKLT